MYIYIYIYKHIFSICSVCISILDVLNAFLILMHASLPPSLSLSHSRLLTRYRLVLVFILRYIM